MAVKARKNGITNHLIRVAAPRLDDLDLQADDPVEKGDDLLGRLTLRKARKSTHVRIVKRHLKRLGAFVLAIFGAHGGDGLVRDKPFDALTQ